MGIAVSPDGTSVYAVNHAGGTMSVCNIGTGGVLSAASPALVAAGAEPDGIVASRFIPCRFFAACGVHIQFVGNNTVVIHSTLIQAERVGILVERIVSNKRVPVGRVPFGPQRKGRLRIRWNLRVNGHKLAKGRYVITLRALDKHKHVIALAHPVTITVR
jgi:hypothetical protein